MIDVKMKEKIDGKLEQALDSLLHRIERKIERAMAKITGEDSVSANDPRSGSPSNHK